MKIIQVSAYYSPHIGGQEYYVKSISELLAKKGYDIEVLTSNIGHKFEIIKKSNLTIKYLKSFEFAHTPIIYPLFFNLLKIKSNSIIHLHTAQAFTAEIVYVISILKSIPYIAHIHADVHSSGKWGFLLPLYKSLILKRILKRASKIIVPTKDYISIISSNYQIDKSKIAVIPAGINIYKVVKLNKKLHYPIRILFVGRLTRQKNLPLLIKTFKIINKLNSNTKLYIAGDGDYRNKLIYLIKKEKLNKDIMILGPLQGKKLYNFFNNSDIFISTSFYESFGISNLEAMAFGLPIVSSNIKGIRNIIKNNKTGLLVKQTPVSFARAVNKLINNPSLRNNLKANGLKEVSKYKWENIIPNIEKIYTSLQYEAK